MDRKTNKKEKQTQIETLTRVCCDLDRDSKISSTRRSDRNDAMLSFTSLHYQKHTEIKKSTAQHIFPIREVFKKIHCLERPRTRSMIQLKQTQTNMY